MSTKRVKCDKCDSTNIKKLNPQQRDIINNPICKINCECNDCGFKFTINSWTKYGKRKGILY